MNQKKTLIVIFILLFGAACFGGGTLFGQHVLVASGFVYGDPADAATGEEVNGIAETAVADTMPVNLNTAGYDELMSVNGIGEVTAKKILDARNEAGIFSDTYDLVTFGVMGDAKYNNLKDYLTVD
jgi:competence protein ComEA